MGELPGRLDLIVRSHILNAPESLFMLGQNKQQGHLAGGATNGIYDPGCQS